MVQKSGEPVKVGSWNHIIYRVLAPSQVVKHHNHFRYLVPSTWLFLNYGGVSANAMDTTLIRWKCTGGTSKRKLSPNDQLNCSYISLCHIHQQYTPPTWMALKISDSMKTSLLDVHWPISRNLRGRFVWTHTTTSKIPDKWCHHIPLRIPGTIAYLPTWMVMFIVHVGKYTMLMDPTVDGRNPANQLRLVV